MDRLKIRIHPLFFGFVFLLILLNKWVAFVNYIVVLFLHEYAHAYVANKLGYSIKNITVLPFGIALNLWDKCMDSRDEIKIAIAGPIMNLILILVCLAMWWLFPITYMATNVFVFANAITLIFNLIPILPLDGGRVLVGAMSEIYDRNKVCKWCYLFNVVTGLVFLVSFVLSIVYGSINFTYLFASIFVIVSGMPTNSKSLTYSYNNITVKKTRGVVRTKVITVDMYTPVYRMTRYMSRSYHLIIHVIDSNGRVVGILDEYKLMSMLRNNSTCCVYDMLEGIAAR